MRKILTLLILLLLSQLILGQEVIDRILAIVDDNIILESEVLQFAQSLALQNRADPMKFMQDPKVKQQILQELIDQKVILTWAKEDTTVFVEDREVQRELDSRLQSMIDQVGSEAELEKLYGKSMREIRRDYEGIIKENLLVDKFRQKELSGAKVNRSEVEDFYKEYKKELSDRPETIELAHILLEVNPSPQAGVEAKELIDSLYQALQEGAEFAELAQEFSQDRGTAKKGGTLGWAKRGDFVPEFEEVAFSLEPGEISMPVKSRFGYHIILLQERQGEKVNLRHILIKLTPTDEDRRQILALADSIYELLQGGADFAELAREFSDDEETAAEGGYIGSFSSTELMPVYAKEVKNLAAGEFSKPLKTDLGIQIVKLISRQKQRPLTLKEDWETIYRMALNKKRDEKYLKWIDKLKKDVYIEVKG